MISRYAVYGAMPEKTSEGEMFGEFDRLEAAMDFAEFYRRKHNAMRFCIIGITYNRTDEKKGRVISEWNPIPNQLKEEAAADFIAYLQEDIME